MQPKPQKSKKLNFHLVDTFKNYESIWGTLNFDWNYFEIESIRLEPKSCRILYRKLTVKYDMT